MSKPGPKGPSGTPDPGGPRKDRRRRSKVPTDYGMRRRSKTVNGNNATRARKIPKGWDK